MWEGKYHIISSGECKRLFCSRYLMASRWVDPCKWLPQWLNVGQESIKWVFTVHTPSIIHGAWFILPIKPPMHHPLLETHYGSVVDGTPTELMSGFTLITYPLNYSSGPEVQSEPTTTTLGEPQAIDGWWTWNFSIGFNFYSQPQQSVWLLVFTTYLLTTHQVSSYVHMNSGLWFHGLLWLHTHECTILNLLFWGDPVEWTPVRF